MFPRCSELLGRDVLGKQHDETFEVAVDLQDPPRNGHAQLCAQGLLQV